MKLRGLVRVFTFRSLPIREIEIWLELDGLFGVVFFVYPTGVYTIISLSKILLGNAIYYTARVSLNPIRGTFVFTGNAWVKESGKS